MTQQEHTGSTGTTWLLSRLVESVPHARSAVLLSSEGLVKSTHGLDIDASDQMAATASGLYSLARATAQYLGDYGARQVVVELETALLSISTAGPGTCLAVLTEREVDAAVLSHEMTTLVKNIRPHLATPVRTPIGP